MTGMATPHFRSLETLALAIEAQGSHAPDHLLRTSHYAVELGRNLGLGEAELEALHVAAILHDVGELAVPQSILSKSGGLTAQEFERMKSHAATGALIVERAELPRPAAEMVRSHHERWDGSGYPDGLRGREIPLGARILAVADCLAGAALPALQTGAGTAFDPRIVQVAVDSHTSMELAARQACGASEGPDFRAGIGAARREERLLCQLTGQLGNSLRLPETLSAFDSHLRELISYHAIAVYRVLENRLTPAYVNGDDAQLFCAVEIPCGEGPSGMAAATGEPVVNGDPGADAAHAGAGCEPTTLHSALTLPLESRGEPIAVLALYHAAPEAFGSQDLRILLTVRDKLALAVEHAVRQEQADQLAAVDTLTGLPNRRALFQRLDAELARCRRNRATLALLVCEIDGLRQWGAPAARRLSKDIASGLRRICREEDCVARMGEGFVLALGGFSARDLPEKRRLIESLLAELAPPESLVPRIGAAYHPGDGDYAEDLLACADLRLNGAISSQAEATHRQIAVMKPGEDRL
jgi:diguanylate cyclase (GGDEF)-like protein/putative nucleotidyltransferase with HDIG domain